MTKVYELLQVRVSGRYPVRDSYDRSLGIYSSLGKAYEAMQTSIKKEKGWVTLSEILCYIIYEKRLDARPYAEEVFIHYGKDTIYFEIDSFRIHKGCVLVTFKDHHHINDVEKYKGLDLLVEVDGSEDDDFYYYELEGCQVYYHDELLGEVSEILETQAHEILRISCEGKKDILIPYVERFILNVDADEKRIDVDVIEGML